MHKKLIEFNKQQRVKETPDLKSGDVVKVHRRFFEGGKELSQIFEGMVIAIKGRQSASPMVTVRKVSHGIGAEIIVPLHSPMVSRFEVVKSARVKRSKLYYVRDKAAKSLKLKYTETAKPKTEKKASKKKEEPKAE